MTESTVDWFVAREKYCSLAENVRLINLVNKAKPSLNKVVPSHPVYK